MEDSTITKTVIGMGLLIVATIIILTLTTTTTDEYTDLYPDNFGINEDFLGANSSSFTLNQTALPNTLSATHNNQTWLEFDGVDDYVIPNQTFMNFHNGTVCQWVKIIGNDTLFQGQTFFRSNADYRTIIGGYMFDDQEFSITKGNPSSQIFNLDFNSTYRIGNSSVWNHYCLSYKTINETSGTYYVYLNGEYVSKKNYIDISTNSSLIYIGGFSNTDNLLNGSIDDTLVYNKSLDAIDINNVYYSKFGLNLSIPVIYYHSICPTAPTLCINNSEFRNHLDVFNNSDYKTITDIEYYNWTIDGGFEMPEKPFMIHFDDGWNTTMNASETMAEYGYKGSIVLNTYWIDFPESHSPTGFLSWENISTLINVYNWSVISHSDSGAVYGNHSNYLKFSSDDERIGNLSSSKQKIIDNTGFTPISFVFPTNDFGQYQNVTLYKQYDIIPFPNIMTLCSANYTLCWGYNANPAHPQYVNKDSGHYDGTLYRIGVSIVDGSSVNLPFVFDSKDYLQNIKMNLKLSENSGITAYDVSGNGNNGIISGATWNNDGVDVPLVNGTDYTWTPNLFKIINDEYSWTGINVTYSYNSGATKITTSLSGNFTGGIRNVSEKFSTILLIVAVVFLFGALALLIRNSRMLNITSESSSL